MQNIIVVYKNNDPTSTAQIPESALKGWEAQGWAPAKDATGGAFVVGMVDAPVSGEKEAAEKEAAKQEAAEKEAAEKEAAEKEAAEKEAAEKEAAKPVSKPKKPTKIDGE